MEPVAGAEVPAAPLAAACVAPPLLGLAAPVPAAAVVVPVRGVELAAPAPALPEVAAPVVPAVVVTVVDGCMVLDSSLDSPPPPHAALAQTSATTLVTRNEYDELDITIHPRTCGQFSTPTERGEPGALCWS